MPEIEIPEIREIAPPLPLDSSWPLYIWLLIAAGAIVLLALGILLLKRRPAQAAAQAIYDPRESALTKLHNLKEDHTSRPANRFALQSSNALREYLTAFYGVMTPYETGREFLDRQGEHGLMDDAKFAAVSQLFERAESLKYAPAPGADSLRLDLVQDLITFVREDIPGPKLQPAGAANPETDSDSDSDADPLPA